MVVDNSPEARLNRLQEKGQTGTAVQNLQEKLNQPPFAGVPPATTPTAPTPTPLAPQVTDGQKFTQAPVDTNTGLSTPQQPTAPVAPITPVQPVETKATPTKAPKVEPVVDFTQAKGREQDIINNLNTFKSQGMSPAEIMRASDYQNASPEKKALIEPYLKQTVPTTSEMYNLIVAKSPIPDEQKLTPSYKIAQNRYNRANTYSSMTPSQVSGAMDKGQIIEGSQTWEDLKSTNPKLVQDVQNLRIVNGNRTNLYTENPDGTRTNNLVKTYEEQFMEDYSDLFKVQSVAEIIAQVKTADVIEAESKANQYEDEMNAIEADMAKIDKEIDQELAGTGATGSRARLEKIIRRDALNDELNRLNKLYTTQANRANQLMTQNASALQTQMAQESARRSAIAGIMKSQFDNEMSFQNKVREQEYAQQLTRESMNDPYTAIPQMVAQYQKMGIPFERSVQQIIQDFEGSGQDLATYLTSLQKTIQGKPEFKRYQQIQQGQLSEAEKLSMQYQQQTAMQDRTFSQQLALNDVNFNQDVKKLAMQYDMNDAKSRTDFRRDLISNGMSETQADAIVRNETGDWNGVTGEKLLYAEDGTFIKSTLKNTTNPNGGIECAEYISKMVGSRVGSTWEEKKKLNTETTGGIGSIAVWQPVKSGELAKYGHAGIIVGEDGDNWRIKSANYNVDGKISTDTIPKSKIEGYRTTKLKESLGGQQFSDNAIAISEGYGSLADLTATEKATILPQLKKIIESKMTDDKDRNFILKSALSNKEISDSTTQKMKDMQTVKFQLGEIEKTLKNINVGPIMGILEGKNPWNTESQVALAQLAGLTPKVARGIFGEVGVLTDADIQNYQRALPNLTSTEEKNKLIVKFMKNLLAEGYKQSIVTDAKANRNVAGFLDDYDEMNQYTINNSTSRASVSTQPGQYVTPITPITATNGKDYSSYFVKK